MADNSPEATSPVGAPTSSANEQHIFESALLVDLSHTSATPVAPTSEAAPTASTSDPTPAEASSLPTQEPDTTAPASESEQAKSPPAGGSEPLHCWICLTDEGVDSTTTDWRSPCPCNLTAHEDCLLQWISETESSARKDGVVGYQKITCPQCKSEIKVERPTEFLVLLEELLSAVGRQIMLPAGVMMLGGILYSGSMVYGFNVLELVFGPDGGRCLFRGLPTPLSGTRSLIERAPRLLSRVFEMIDTTSDMLFPFWPRNKDNWLFWLAPWIAPTLLVSRTHFADRIFGAVTLPSILVLSYQTLTDPSGSPAFAWPPTPALALLSLPYIRTLYIEAYVQVFAEHEKRWRLATQRHPREGETAEEIAAEGRDELDANMLGIEIEVVDVDDAPAPPPDDEGRGLPELAREVGDLQRQVAELNGMRPGENENLQAFAEADAEPFNENAGAQEEAVARRDAANAAVADGAAPVQPGEAPQERANANARAEPAARQQARRVPNNWEFRQNVSVFTVARTAVATLLFPAVSSVVGNILEVVLPKTWVTKPSIPISTGGFVAGVMSLWSGKQTNVGAGTWKRGLLQEKWGRTIVGGMIVVGVKDAVSLYMLWRRATIEGQRKVLNYEGRNRQGRRDRNAARAAAREARA